MKIAGQVGAVTTCFDSTIEYCRPYLTDEAPDFSVAVTPEDRAFEQQASIEEALEEGIKPRKYGEPHLERAGIQRKFAEALFDRDILMVHGSAVALDGEGFLFTADCGTGKSTHTRFWREIFGDRAVMVNDDKPLLRVKDGQVTVYGTPWNGKHRLGNNISVPLKALCILERGEKNTIEKVDAANVLPLLMQQINRMSDPVKMFQTMDLLGQLLKCVPIYRLKCNMDPEAAKVSYEGMQ